MSDLSRENPPPPPVMPKPAGFGCFLIVAATVATPIIYFWPWVSQRRSTELVLGGLVVIAIGWRGIAAARPGR